MQADDLTFHRYREYDISGAIRCEGVRRMVTAVHGTIAGRRTSLALFLHIAVAAEKRLQMVSRQ